MLQGDALLRMETCLICSQIWFATAKTNGDNVIGWVWLGLGMWVLFG